MEKSRQVLRAEFRAEMKKGAQAARRRTRKKRQQARDLRPTMPPTIRIVAMRAVSRLSGFGRGKKTAE